MNMKLSGLYCGRKASTSPVIDLEREEQAVCPGQQQIAAFDLDGQQGRPHSSPEDVMSSDSSPVQIGSDGEDSRHYLANIPRQLAPKSRSNFADFSKGQFYEDNEHMPPPDRDRQRKELEHCTLLHPPKFQRHQPARPLPLADRRPASTTPRLVKPVASYPPGFDKAPANPGVASPVSSDSAFHEPLYLNTTGHVMMRHPINNNNSKVSNYATLTRRPSSSVSTPSNNPRFMAMQDEEDDLRVRLGNRTHLMTSRLSRSSSSLAAFQQPLRHSWEVRSRLPEEFGGQEEQEAEEEGEEETESGFYQVSDERYQYGSEDNINLPLPSDPSARRQLLQSQVSCIRLGAGCSWKGQLAQLQSHLANSCQGLLPLIGSGDGHCVFCRGKFPAREIADHQSVCGFEPVMCGNNCGMKVTRNRLRSHMLEVCSKREVQCRYCCTSLPAHHLQNHHLRCPKFPVPCPNRCGGEFSRALIGQHVDQCGESLATCNYRESAGCVWRGTSLETHLRDSADYHLELLLKQCKLQEDTIHTLKSELETARTSKDGLLLWRITNVSQKMAEAKSSDGLELVSRPFYTSPVGYRLQASLFLNGNGAGEGSHLSVYVRIVPGEFDSVLKWPFRHTVSFALLDQNPDRLTAVNVVESFLPDPGWSNFARPSPTESPDQLGFGFPRFVGHEVLATRNYVKSDTLYIRIKTDPSQSVRV